MNGVLLDTNHISAAIRKVSIVRDRIRQEIQIGRRLGTCIAALLEVEVGIQQTASPAEYRRRLNALMPLLRLWPIERDLAPFYAETFLELRRQGRALSQVDLMLASLARQKGFELATTDRDFEALPDVKIVNWLL